MSPISSQAEVNPPELLLAKVYRSDIKIQDYWVSEKLDGVRGYWNGSQLLSRKGNVLHAPRWFIDVLPDVPLDGELWLGRGRFEQLSGIVRRRLPEDYWREVKFMIFDLPGSHESFDNRLLEIKKLVDEIASPHIRMVHQFKVTTHKTLIEKLDDVVRHGAEGLMLHLGASYYSGGRKSDLLKLKKHEDTEAVVVRHFPGKGKFKGMLGAIEVEMKNKKRFKIGTGFSDQDRRALPPIGTTITFKYFGLTNKGLPRFASYLRVRAAH